MTKVRDRYSKKDRRAEQMLSLGLTEKEVALELLLMLPDDFVHEYEILYHRVWGRVRDSRIESDAIAADEASGRTVSEDERQLRLWGREIGGASDDRYHGDSRDLQDGAGGAGRAGNRVKDRPSGQGGFGIRDEVALNIKKKVDRKLRAIARQIKEASLDEVESRPASSDAEGAGCKVCGRFCAGNWKHCAWCGYGLRQGRNWNRLGQGHRGIPFRR